MILFAVDENNDVYLDPKTNGIARASGAEALRQKVVHRLKLFKGEWFLDISRGVPYFQNILGENISLSLATQILTNEIKKEPEVVDVQNISFNFDSTRRTYGYTATIISIYSENFAISI